MADVPSEMSRAGLEFAAQEHADAARLEKKVEDMQGGQGGPGAEPGEASPAPAAALPDETTLKLCATIISVADRFIVGFTAPELALTTDEQQQIATAAVPVIDKHLPDLLKKLSGTPEGLLLITTALIYASKAPALLAPKPAKKAPAPAPSSAPVVTQAASA